MGADMAAVSLAAPRLDEVALVLLMSLLDLWSRGQIQRVRFSNLTIRRLCPLRCEEFGVPALPRENRVEGCLADQGHGTLKSQQGWVLHRIASEDHRSLPFFERTEYGGGGNRDGGRRCSSSPGGDSNTELVRRRLRRVRSLRCEIRLSDPPTTGAHHARRASAPMTPMTGLLLGDCAPMQFRLYLRLPKRPVSGATQ
jgi:hypothetical protein